MALHGLLEECSEGRARAANTENGTFKSAEDLRAIYEREQGLHPDDNIIAFSPLSLQIFTLVEGDFKAGPSVMLGDQLHDVAAGDLNGDGRVDLAVAGQNNCYILINQSP